MVQSDETSRCGYWFCITGSIIPGTLVYLCSGLPGVHPGPGGFLPYQAGHVLCRLCREKNRVAGSDEPCPTLAYSTMFEVTGYKSGEFKRWNANNPLFFILRTFWLWMAQKNRYSGPDQYLGGLIPAGFLSGLLLFRGFCFAMPRDVFVIGLDLFRKTCQYFPVELEMFFHNT